MTEHTLTYNIEQLEPEKFELLKRWRKDTERATVCPRSYGNNTSWKCATCRAIFPEVPENMQGGEDCVKRGPCATLGNAFVDFVVDKVLALGPKEEKKPFVPYAVFSKGSSCVRKVINEKDGKLFCSMTHTDEGHVWFDNKLRAFIKIEEQSHALRILLDVTGQKSMVEAIKAELMHVRDSGNYVGAWERMSMRFLDFITDLEAKNKE